MGKEEAKKVYTHYVPSVKVTPDWHKQFNFVLVENIEQLASILNGVEDNKFYMSFDTETSSLDPEKGFIVGYSFSFDGKSAYYVPVNHHKDKYNMYEVALDMIYDKMLKARRVIMYNARFDMRMMEYYGYNDEQHGEQRFKFLKYDMSKVNFFDVGVPCWLSDTNIKMPSLKECSLRFLGYKMMTYEEVSGGVENFYYIDPEECYFYAASDALCTYLLVGATIKYHNEAEQISKVDNAFLYPLMHCEKEKIWLDQKGLSVLDLECREALDRIEKEVYDNVGYVFKLNSPMQVSAAFSRLGIDTGGRTKTGYMKTGIDELEALPEDVKNQHPALAKFVEYKVTYKFLSSYVKVLLEIAKEKGFARCSYKTNNVPTGRLASGKDTKNTFFSPFNVQSTPKPHPCFYYALDIGDRSKFSKKDNIIMGYQFVPVEYNDSGKIIDGSTLHENFVCTIEGMSQKLNVRSTLLPKLNKDSNEDEWVWTSIDFCISPNTLVELRDGTKIPLEDLEGKEVDIKTPQGFYKARNFRYTGKKKVCKLKLKSGKEVICSPEHRFKVRCLDGVECWKELKNILTSDYVMEDSI